MISDTPPVPFDEGCELAALRRMLGPRCVEDTMAFVWVEAVVAEARWQNVGLNMFKARMLWSYTGWWF